MPDRVITGGAAQTLQDRSDRDELGLTWIVMEAEDSAGVIARPIAAGRGALPVVLVAATIAGLRAQLPAGLTRSGRQPRDPPGLIEVWTAI